MRRNTIKQFVRERAAQGMEPEAIWHAAEKEFYHVGWCYVLSLVREFSDEQAERRSA